MATVMLENGADIRYIQEMLGHVELSTTQIYAQVSIRQLKAVHALTHPGAKLVRAERPPTTPWRPDERQRTAWSLRPPVGVARLGATHKCALCVAPCGARGLQTRRRRRGARGRRPASPAPEPR
jgi:hypothetical protein